MGRHYETSESPQGLILDIHITSLLLRLSGEERLDALMRAIGEHLCRRWQFGLPPPWTEDPARFLSRPWFMGPERMKGFLLVESPAVYRRRLIFTEAEPLRRAWMPRDGRVVGL